eukprot:maker-scaffold_30-snap-gene-0.9-mRNA-1 protein AED:0.00 eAED:0.00 QI:166/1/1/1/1/1/2/75/619
MQTKLKNQENRRMSDSMRAGLNRYRRNENLETENVNVVYESQLYSRQTRSRTLSREEAKAEKSSNSKKEPYFYAKAIFIIVKLSERYGYFISEETLVKKQRKKYNAKLHHSPEKTSLVMFRNEFGEVLNTNKTPKNELISVEDKSIITIFGNSAYGSKFLCCVGIKGIVWSSEEQLVGRNGKDGNEIRKYQFIVHKAPAVKKIKAANVLVEIGKLGKNKIQNFVRNGRRTNDTTLTRLSQISGRSGFRWTRISTKSTSRPPQRVNTRFNEPNFALPSENMGLDQIVDTREEEPSQRVSKKKGRFSLFSQRNRAKTVYSEPQGKIYLEEDIYLESVEYPGSFVTFDSNSNILLEDKPQRFMISDPTLEQLTKIRQDPAFSKPENTFLTREIQLSEHDKKLQSYIKTLPFELSFHILQYTDNWTKIGRTMCKQFKRLAERNIRGLKIHSQYEEIEPSQKISSFFNLIQSCPNLREASIRNVEDLTNKNFLALYKPMRGRRLKYPKMKTLAFGGCTNLGNGFLKHLDLFPNLLRLNIAVTAVDDYGLELLAEKAPNIENLNLYSCDGVSERGIFTLIDKLPRLKEINIRGTKVGDLPPQILSSNRPPVRLLTGPREPESIYT